MIKVVPLSGFMSRVEVRFGIKGTKARQKVADFFKMGIATIYRHERLDDAMVLIDAKNKKSVLVAKIASTDDIL